MLSRLRQTPSLTALVVVGVGIMLLVSACGGKTFDAKGLAFEYPDGFQEAEGTTSSTLVLEPNGNLEQQGVVALHWTDQDQPDARPVINAALRESGADFERYNRLRLEQIETAEVDGQPADYLELVVEHDEDDGAPRYFGRLLLFSSPDDSINYIVGHIVQDDHRQEPQVVQAWERISSTLKFDQSSAQ